jgi:hypothetical protein
MSDNAELRVDPAAFIDDIEKRVSEIFSAQKSEVEQSLIEKINREKEEAQRRIEAVNQQFTQVRSVLEDHKKVMAELRETDLHLRGEIRGHFERAVNYQKMMEHAANLAGDELEKIGGINQELEKVRLRAESEYENIKNHLGSYAGIMAAVPAPSNDRASDVDWNGELGKLRKVRDLLATLRQADPPLDGPSPLDAACGDEATAPATPEAEELAVSLGLIDEENDGVKDDIEFAASAHQERAVSEDGCQFEAAAPAEPEPFVEPAAEPPADLLPVLDALARYRRTESVNNGIELGFFAAEAASVLDADSFIAAVGKVVENASQLHAQLAQAASVKDLFLLKQEILNQQEILRKVFFRVVRFCDKENGRVPETLTAVVSPQGMKDLIERLTMANWSDPSDFKPFLNELGAMKRAFETRTAADPRYLKAVLDEVEGREN